MLENKTIAIVQSNYIPWKGYFDMINQVDEFVIFDEVQYTRRDWRNRNKIKTEQGLQWLTIPVKSKGEYFQKISETQISDPSWANNHLTTIRRIYGKSAGYEKFGKQIADLFEVASDLEFLSEVNTLFLQGLCDCLGITTLITQSSDYELAEDKTDRLLGICKQAGAERYISGPAAKSYLDESKFEEKNVEVSWMKYDGFREYPQPHGEFEHGVSVIDVLFNAPDEATELCKQI